jgi:RIO-like serine/threonine protein kinase
MVHGDVRETNVMVKDSGLEFMLVDYDWVGSQGHAGYPRHVNKAVKLGRPEDVEDG